jgi:hypothetical protein
MRRMRRMRRKSESRDRVQGPSASEKRIRGVMTTAAAFVGRAPGGPVNEPVWVRTWSEFVEAFSDPDRPGRGPFMEGAYLPHAP